MGITLKANKSAYSFDMGCGGFFNLRANIAELFDEEFGEHYRKYQTVIIVKTTMINTTA